MDPHRRSHLLDAPETRRAGGLSLSHTSTYLVSRREAPVSPVLPLTRADQRRRAPPDSRPMPGPPTLRRGVPQWLASELRAGRPPECADRRSSCLPLGAVADCPPAWCGSTTPKCAATWSASDIPGPR